MKDKIELELIIECSGVDMWGRIDYNGKLITDVGETLEQLELNMKNQLYDVEALAPAQVSFSYFYDVNTFADRLECLDASKVAERAGIDPVLLQQYITGSKYPQREEAQRIEEALHSFADDIKRICIINPCQLSS